VPGTLESAAEAGKVLSNILFLFLSLPLSLSALSHPLWLRFRFFAHLEQCLALYLVFVGLLKAQAFILSCGLRVLPSVLKHMCIWKKFVLDFVLLKKKID